jgi:WXG100 family type VII secretion target
LAETIQVQYDDLDQLAAHAFRQADHLRIVHRKIQSQVEQLARSWSGEGARNFQGEMEDVVLPGLKRLAAALELTGNLVQKVGRVFREGEEEAVAQFPENDGKAKGAFLEWVHGVLDVAGFVPGLGEIADGANAAIYLVEGRYWEAGISAAAMLPILGDLGKAGKWGVKAGKEITEAAAERELREAAAKRVVREATEAQAVREIFGANRVPLGRVPADELPSSAFGSGAYGNKMHYDILPDRLRQAFPDLKLEVTPRGVEGPDLRVVGGGDRGFDWIEIKPDSKSGIDTFVREEWAKSDPWRGRGRLVVYDEHGNYKLIDYELDTD